jgi:serine/threonine-protein phosphatase 2A regulatory subunit A
MIQVRAAAAAGISLLSKHLSKDVVLARILPVIQRLVTDSSEHVRASLANVVNDLAPVLGKQDTVEHLLPVLLLFLRDETSEVRLNIISTLEKINNVIGVDLLSHALLPAIVELAEDTNWRVRSAIIEHMPMLAQRLGTEFFSDKLNTLCLTWLSDSVFSVRKAAVDTLPKLSKLFGDEWTKEQIIPHLDRMHVNTNYLQRMTALYGVQQLALMVSVSALESSLLPLVLEMATDAVPNVRFTVARTLYMMKPRIQSAGLLDQMQSVLHSMSDDSDRDVRYYSSQQAAAAAH